ncbi:WxL domain-containing protein [Exiguobacterium profundum]|uniref:WxL domain-containing protein n=1 Tax=Exiguobacterium profundum TaxID=307643 RepID=UPI0039195547
MRKKCVRLMLLSSMLCFGNMMTVSAMSGETEATIEFTELGVPDIYDPATDAPFSPQPDANDGFVNTTAAELTLDFAPNLYFGTHTVRDTMALEYVAQATVNGSKLPRSLLVQVTDRRTTFGNWSVHVKAAPFERTTVPDVDSLPGAYFTFNGGEVKSPLGETLAPLLSSDEIKVNTDDQYVNVMSAVANTGQFTWLAHWTGAGASVKLRVANNTMQVGQHVSKLTWSLTPNLLPPVD